MSWITFATTAAGFIIGPFGIALFAVLLGVAGIRAGIEHHMRPIGWAMLGGVVTFSAAWAVQTFMTA